MLQKLASVALILMGLVGCASVPMGDLQQDAAYKLFSAKPDVAGIYIVRNEFMGAAYRMEVYLDGKLLGQTAPYTYLYTEVSPGNHIVTSNATENSDSLEVDTVAGRLYYIWQEVILGSSFFRTKLHLVTEAEGKKWVLETKLAAPAGHATAAPTRTSGTVASARLQSDVMGMISVLESAEGGSKNPVFVSASGAGRSGPTVIEHWTVDSNGRKINYEVRLTPSPRGGVDYRAVRLQSR